MFQPLIRALGTLALLAGSGFLIFRHPVMQRKILPYFLFLVLSVLFPLYFAFRIPAGWAEAMTLGWPFLAGMFVLCLATTALLAFLSRMTIRLRPGLISEPTTYMVLGSMHNAGFIPLPILERMAPDSIMVGMSFYFLAFNIVFWTAAVTLIRTGHFSLWPLRVRVSPSLVGVGVGLAVSVTGLYRYIPQPVMEVGGRLGGIGLDLAIVALGGALAGIHEKIEFDREHWYFASWRMVLFPLLFLGIAALPLPVFAGELGWGLRLLLVLEAATPPATQTLVVTRAYGRPSQMHYTGSMTLFSYLVGLVTLPLFVGLAVALFS